MATWTPLLAAALVLGCGDKDNGDDTGGGPGDGAATDGGTADGGGTTDGGTAGAPDRDGDGYTTITDCDDDNADVNPGMTEVCNGIDDNCDDVVDEDAADAVTMYEDRDGDGYGNPLASILACEGDSTDGYVADNRDCRDSDPDINPDGREVCDEANLDEDCDGLRDDDDDSVDILSMSTWFADYDLDGFGDPATLVQGCDEGGVRSLNELDCDDTDDSVGPDSSCAPFDGVWTGAVAFDVEGIHTYSGECTDTGSVTVSDASTTQITGSVVCDYYGYYPVTMMIYGQIDYPWGVSGHWADEQYWFAYGGAGTDYTDGTQWETSFSGEFSADGSTLILDFEGARDDLFDRHDVSLEGTWSLNQ